MDKKDWVQAIGELKSAASLEFEDAKHKRTYGTHFIEYFPHREMGIAYYNLNEIDDAKRELGLSYSYVQSDRASEFLNKIEPNLADKTLKSFEERKNAISGNLASEEKKKKEEEDRAAAERIKSAQEELERIRTANRQETVAEHQKKAEDERTAAAQRRQKEAADSLAVSQKALAEQKQREEAEKVAVAQRRQKEMADSLAASQKAFAEQKQKENEQKAATEKTSLPANVENKVPLPVGALTYDPSRVTQVGSRLSLAVLPFEGKGESKKYIDAATEKMITQLVNLRRFKVIERSAIDKVIREQSLQSSGTVDDKTAVKLGKIAGADAIVIGSITGTSQFLKVNARVVDTETSETIVAKDAQAPETSIDAVEKLASNIGIMIYNELPLVEGYVVSQDQDIWYIDIGMDRGVRKGTKCVIFREGDVIKHPITGEILGRKVTKLGELVVTDVQEKLASGRIIEKEQDIRIGDKVVVK
jgi:curli biogenesis system outer membrane secretion channel CsgG